MFSFLFLSVFAQEDTLKETSCSGKLEVKADLMSRYIWRGINSGGNNVPSIQPSITYSVGGFSLGLWGENSIGSDNYLQEVDFVLSYNNEYFGIILTDYFTRNDTAKTNHFFEFDDEKTSHCVEVALFSAPIKELPIGVLFAINVWGADAKNKDGDIYYTSYMELSYEKTIKDTDLKVFLGSTLNKPDEGLEGFYKNENNGVINVGFTLSKELKITDKFSVPIQSSFIVNPESENVFMTFGMTF